MKKGSGVHISEIQFGEQDSGHSSQSPDSAFVASKPHSRMASRRSRWGPSPIQFAHMVRNLDISTVKMTQDTEGIIDCADLLSSSARLIPNSFTNMRSRFNCTLGDFHG